MCRSRSRDPFPTTLYWFSFGVLSGFVLYEVTGVDFLSEGVYVFAVF